MGANINAHLVYGVWYSLDGTSLVVSELVDEAQLGEPECPIDVVFPKGDDTEVIIYVKSCSTKASFGFSEEPVMVVDEAAVAVARNFCERQLVSFNEPKWWLIADTDLYMQGG